MKFINLQFTKDIPELAVTVLSLHYYWTKPRALQLLVQGNGDSGMSERFLPLCLLSHLSQVLLLTIELWENNTFMSCPLRQLQQILGQPVRAIYLILNDNIIETEKGCFSTDNNAFPANSTLFSGVKEIFSEACLFMEGHLSKALLLATFVLV